MKIENKRQWVGELFFLLGTILYITYYFFYIAYYWYVEKDPTRQIPVQRLFYIGLICFVVKIILTKYQWKEVIIGAAGAVLMYLCWKSSGGIDYPANYLIILAMKDVDLKKVMKEIKPKKLYVAADGPRDLQEKEMCDKTRDIIKQVDWNCELHLMYRDENIGCKYGPYESISWFFNHEEEGVILEDDCVPDLTFFPFVREMLVKYRNDNRISMIAGHGYFSQQMDWN